MHLLCGRELGKEKPSCKVQASLNGALLGVRGQWVMDTFLPLFVSCVYLFAVVSRDGHC